MISYRVVNGRDFPNSLAGAPNRTGDTEPQKYGECPFARWQKTGFEAKLDECRHRACDAHAQKRAFQPKRTENATPTEHEHR